MSAHLKGTPYRIEKGMLSSKELFLKINLYGGAGISALGKIWLTHSAEAQCTLEGKHEANGQRKILCLKFSCLTIKYDFYFALH